MLGIILVVLLILFLVGGFAVSKFLWILAVCALIWLIVSVSSSRRGPPYV